jgi:hypothetical protein
MKTCEVEDTWAPEIYGPEMMYGNRPWKKMQFFKWYVYGM